MIYEFKDKRKLNLEITGCKDCPYYEEQYFENHYVIGGHDKYYTVCHRDDYEILDSDGFHPDRLFERCELPFESVRKNCSNCSSFRFCYACGQVAMRMRTNSCMKPGERYYGVCDRWEFVGDGNKNTVSENNRRDNQSFTCLVKRGTD